MASVMDSGLLTAWAQLPANISFNLLIIILLMAAALLIAVVTLALYQITRRDESLRENERRYRVLVENGYDLILRIRPDGEILVANSVYSNYVRVPTGSFLDRLTDPQRAEFECALDTITPAAPRTEFGFDWVRPDGGHRWLHWQMVGLFDSHDALKEILLIGDDMTVQKRIEDDLRENERRYRALFDSANDAVFIMDLDGTHVEINQRAADLLGYDNPADLLGLSPRDTVVPEEIEASNKRYSDMLLGGSPPIYERTFRHRDGHHIATEINALVVRNEEGSPRYIQSIVRDITERKRMEQAEREQRILAEALRDTAIELTSTFDLNEVFARVLSNLAKVVPYEAGMLLLLEKGNFQVRDVWLNNESMVAEEARGQAVSAGDDPLLAQLSPTALTCLASEHLRGKSRIMDWLGYAEAQPHSVVSVPMRAEQQLLGYLLLAAPQSDFYNEQNTQSLQAFASQAALAIENARHVLDLQRQGELLSEMVETRTAELTRVKDRIEVILNNSPDAILMIDHNGRIQMGNSAVYQMIGYHIDALTGTPISHLFDEESQTSLTGLLSKIHETGKASREELVLTTYQNEAVDVDIAISPLREHDEITGMVCSIRDIRVLKEMRRLKDAFVSNVSHELRTPISSLKLFVNLLDKTPDEERPELESLIRRETDRLHHLVEDVLMLSRLDQMRIDMREELVDLNQLLEECVTDRALLASSRNILLIAQSKPATEIITDRRLLGQTLNVFVSNAISYTPAGGRVLLTIKRAQRQGSEWVGLVVDDNGPGILAEDMPHLFDRFYRGAAGRNSGQPGTGLGLAIANQIIQRLRGQIEVTSSGISGEGARFTIWLPALQ